MNSGLFFNGEFVLIFRCSCFLVIIIHDRMLVFSEIATKIRFNGSSAKKIASILNETSYMSDITTIIDHRFYTKAEISATPVKLSFSSSLKLILACKSSSSWMMRSVFARIVRSMNFL